MLYSLRSKEGDLHYLVKKEYTIGRKEADILITNDQSISRKHALIKVQDNKVILVDCGAKYNTFVDDVKIEANTDVVLKPGSSIKFGMFESVYKLEGLSLITTTSGVTSEQKKIIVEQMKYLHCSFINTWNSNCTHLTVNEIMLTVKVLCALIEGRPIVTIKFWDDYVQNVKKNLPAPNAKEYKPSCAEIIINKNIPLDYKEERRTLFTNKIFVFQSESEKKSMEQVIKLAGGKCRSWERQPISKEDLQDSSVEYLIMQNTDNPTNEVSSSLNEIINHLKTLGKRIIPFTELALAIINCSCEKDCNPSFDRTATVLANSAKEQTQPKGILALSTQTQAPVTETSQNIVPSAVIPPTFEASMCDSQSFNPKVNSTVVESKPSDSGTFKRTADSIETIDLCEPKKSKITNQADKFNVFNIKRKKNDDNMDIFSFFKRKKNTDASESESSAVEKSEPKKRKLELINSDESESNSQTKKKDNRLSEIQQKEKRESSKIIDNEGTNPQSTEFISRKERPTDPEASRNTTKFESNSGWLSKNDGNISVKTEVSDETLEFIKSFKDSVVIVEKDLLKKVPPKKISVSEVESPDKSKRNFKVFRKVKPLKEQTIIVPRSRFVKVICNNNSEIQPPLEFERLNDDEEISKPTNSKPQNKKKAFKF